MKLSECRPFVRIGIRFTYKPKTFTFTSLDSRIFYIHKGKGKVVLDGNEYPFSPGTLMLWQAGCGYKFVSDETLLELSAINFDFTYANSHRKNIFKPITVNESNPHINIDKIYFEDAQKLNAPIIIENAEVLEEKIAKIIYEHHSATEFSEEKKSAYIYGLIIDILRHNPLESETAKTNRVINLVIKYISENYSKEISNSELAQIAGYHPYYLNRIFSKKMGITLHQYLISYRLEVAEQMLLTTKAQIGEIAENCGFSTQISLETHFKRKNKMTPTEFRRSHF